MTELGGLLYVMERQKNVLQKRAQVLSSIIPVCNLHGRIRKQ